MPCLIKPVLLSSLLAAGAVHASVVTMQTASSTAGPQADAATYQSTVNAALALPGSHTAVVPLFDGLSNQSVFGGSNQDIAYRYNVTFDVDASEAGTWAVRFGVDFGLGGAVFLDGVPLAFRNTDMWWNGSYADPSQSFQLAGLNIGVGTHSFDIYGLEHCCDGGQQGQFSINGRSYVTFGAADGLTGVPEPASYALAMAGLLALTAFSRRRA